MRKAGARKIYVGCTHPVLSLNALPLMYSNDIEGVVGTDTFAGPISFVSVAPVIAEALKKQVTAAAVSTTTAQACYLL